MKLMARANPVLGDAEKNGVAKKKSKSISEFHSESEAGINLKAIVFHSYLTAEITGFNSL